MFFCLVSALLLTLVTGSSPVGMNLEGKTYYSAGITWKNRLTQSMPWISQNSSSWSDPRPLSLDSNGYVTSLLPNQYAGSLFLDIGSDSNGWTYETQGLHTFYYTGDCSCCIFKFDAKIIDNSKDGEWIVNISDYGNNKAYIRIDCINDPSNYPRDMAIVPNEYLNDWKTQPFDPIWLQPLQSSNGGLPFDVLRFMDFLRTNDSPNKYWSQRTLPSNYTQANDYGVSWEYIIQLAKYLKIKPWINVPHLATDDYITNLAKLWYNELSTSNDIPYIIIEYSNECWNAQFSCYSYCVNESIAAGNGMNNYNWYGSQVCNIEKLFNNVFGNLAESKLYFIMGTQMVNSWITGQELSYNNQSLCVDAVAVASYYCVYNMTDEQIVDSTIDELFDNIESTENREYHRQEIITQLQVTVEYKGRKGNTLELVGYEGSWGCTPHHGEYYDNETEIYNEMVADSRVGATVFDHLMDWNNASNGGLFNIFSFYGWSGQYGDWGHLQYQDSFLNPSLNGRYKFDGIQQYFTQMEKNKLKYSKL